MILLVRSNSHSSSVVVVRAHRSLDRPLKHIFVSIWKPRSTLSHHWIVEISSRHTSLLFVSKKNKNLFARSPLFFRLCLHPLSPPPLKALKDRITLGHAILGWRRHDFSPRHDVKLGALSGVSHPSWVFIRSTWDSFFFLTEIRGGKLLFVLIDKLMRRAGGGRGNEVKQREREH